MSDVAEFLLSQLPCSVELPAGCGKTETIADLAMVTAARQGKTLVLTHTHAGVDALKRRFRRRGIPSSTFTVRTIDSWCFDLIGSFPQLAGITVGAEPDWTLSQQYHESGADAASTPAIQRMLSVSYDLLVVDEYQDCQKWQHELIKSIAEVLPTCVLGDRLQGLFFFGQSRPVSWEGDVVTAFPAVSVPVEPWRWKYSNPELGQWLLDVRSTLMSNGTIDLSEAPVTSHGTAAVFQACRSQPAYPDRVVAIAKWPRECASLVARLTGSFTMIEELEGKHLLAFAEIIDRGDPEEIASECVEFSVTCATGVASVFNSAARKRLREGKPLNSAKYDPHVVQADLVNHLLDDSGPGAVRSAMAAMEQMQGFRLIRREAWQGVLGALRLAEVTPGLTVRDAVVKMRNQLRVTGRHPESRIVARPLLIKGLEFDHAVVVDAHTYNAHELYVCLTRGSKSLTVVSARSALSPRRPG